MTLSSSLAAKPGKAKTEAKAFGSLSLLKIREISQKKIDGVMEARFL